MWVWVATALVLGLVSPAAAQTVMDGSDKNLDVGDRDLVVKLVSRRMFDPSSAQFYSLGYQKSNGQIKKTIICGYVNAKNRLGGYVGVEPFLYNVDTGVVTFLPEELRKTEAETFVQFVEALGCPRP